MTSGFLEPKMPSKWWCKWKVVGAAARFNGLLAWKGWLVCCYDKKPDLRVSKFTNAGWALLGSPGAKGQQSSAGDSEKD